MRKLLLVSALLSLSAASFAAGPAGCGLGSIMFKEKSGLVWNVLAATFNGSSGNQTFGMSSGTSECQVDDKTKVAQVSFIEANKVALANDIARGNGETLASLSSLYGCANTESMGSTLQSKYESIFKGQASAETLNDRITNIIVENKACI
ncbi:MAG: DUF3015 family protein [Bacteriovoracaceae bacterium]|nr:DUF3015 family protein [Bacteriovoracaceae bacterium]